MAAVATAELHPRFNIPYYTILYYILNCIVLGYTYTLLCYIKVYCTTTYYIMVTLINILYYTNVHYSIVNHVAKTRESTDMKPSLGSQSVVIS